MTAFAMTVVDNLWAFCGGSFWQRILQCAPGYRVAVTKSCGNEVLRGIEALLQHESFFYADDRSSIPVQTSL
jgi:hypothetical protein